MNNILRLSNLEKNKSNNNMKTGIFVQARYDSNRLKGKIILPLKNLTMIEHIQLRLNLVPADKRIIVTTAETVPFIKKHIMAGWSVFVGDELNVLKRYYDAMQYYKIDVIIRSTADNPLVSYELANNILDVYQKKSCDYAHFLDIPWGSGVEIIKSKALAEAYQKAKDTYQKEHVTPYLYQNPKLFRCFAGVPADKRYHSHLRVTVDYPEDYEFMKTIYNTLYKNKPLSILDVLDFCKNNHLGIQQHADYYKKLA